MLESADVRAADVVVAATGDDEDNLVTSLLAKQEFGVPRVLARVNHPKNEWLFDEQWGVDASVSPPHILTAMVEEAVTVGDLVRLLRLEGGDIGLVEMRLPERSPNAGRALYELRLPADTTLVAILREGHVMIPQPETALAAGDEIVALARVESEAALRDAVVGGVGTGTTEGASGPGGTAGRVGAEPLAGEFEPGIDHPDVAPLLAQHSLDHDTLAERQPADPAPSHEHGDDLARAVGEQDLQRLLALERQDRHPPDHAGDPNRLTQRRVGDPHGALDRVRPPTDLGGQAGLVALVQTIEEATQDAHVRTWALPPPGAA